MPRKDTAHPIQEFEQGPPPVNLPQHPCPPTSEETEEAAFWTAVSGSALAELWDNPYDAIYDLLPAITAP